MALPDEGEMADLGAPMQMPMQFQFAGGLLGDSPYGPNTGRVRGSVARKSISMQQADTMFRKASKPVLNAIDKLDPVPTIKIHEKRNLFESITGVEQNNTYTVNTFDGQELFLVQESSSCTERTCYCCFPDCKPWRMDFFDLPPGGLANENWDPTRAQPFLHIERPFHCLCCCLCRPMATVSEPDGQLLGKVREPRSRWSYVYSVGDLEGNHLLTSEAACCQSGRICTCPGFLVDFPIRDVSNIRVAEVRKTWTKGDCCPCCFQDWNKYTVEFGQAASAELKLLLVSMAVVVQMRHFDTR